MLADSQTFGLQSLPTIALVLGIGGALILGGLAALFARMIIGLRRIRYEVLPDALQIHAPFSSGRRVAKSVLKLDDAKVVDAATIQAGNYGRTNGVGLPGYLVGWFRSNGGEKAGEKALFCLTDKNQVLRIPTTEDYTLYLSSNAPSDLLAALKKGGETKTFAVPQVSASPFYIFLPVCLVLVGMAACFAYFVVGPKKLAVSDSSLKVSGAIYSTSVTRGEVQSAGVRAVDLDQEKELSPSSRTNGVDLLGYKEGWFKLRGGEKAFVVKTGSKVVYIPTTKGYAILFGTNDPDKLIASLH